MKRLLFFFLLFIPLLSFAHEDQPRQYPFLPKPVEKKFYIEPTQIGFSNNKIYVNFDGDWKSVDAIYADKEGIYIKPFYFNYPWKCKVCGITNEFFRDKCKTIDCTGSRPPKFSIPKPPRPILPPLPPEIQRPLEN